MRFQQGLSVKLDNLLVIAVVPFPSTDKVSNAKKNFYHHEVITLTRFINTMKSADNRVEGERERKNARKIFLNL
jgi:hypothetical protein